MNPLRNRVLPGQAYPHSTWVAVVLVILLVASAIRDVWPW